MAGGYSITISAADAASGTFDAVNKRVEALNKRIVAARAPFTRLGESLSKFARVTGLDKIATGFSNVARGGLETFRALSRVIEPLAAITGAATLAGMYKLVTAWGEFGRTLSQQSSRAGMTADALYQLQSQARLTGVSADTVTSSVTKLADNMRDASVGAAPNFLVVLKNLGVSYDQLRRQSPAEQLQTIAAALGRVRNVTDRALYTREMFGGEGMIPFLNATADGTNRLAERARLLAGAIGPDDLKRALAFAQAQSDLELAASGLGNRIATVLGPALTPLLVQLTDATVQMRLWLEANQAWLQGEISARVKEFGDFLRGVPWHEIGQDILAIAHGADDVAQALGGWKTAAELLLGFFAVRWTAAMMLPIVRVSTALLALPGAAKAAVQAAEGSVGGSKLGKLAGMGGWIGLGIEAATGGLDKPIPTDDDTLRQFPAMQTPADRARLAATPAPPDKRRWWERFYLPGPGLFEGAGATQGGGAARNMRNNNPTNLMFAGQQGATSDGRFARFPNMESGVAADLHQFQLYQDRDHLKSLTDMIYKATPPAENPNVDGYIDRVAAAMGVKRSDAIDLHDRATATKFITAVSTEEGGTADVAAVQRGVDLNLGRLPAATAKGDPVALPSTAGSPGANGRVDMNVRVLGAPAAVTTRSTGNVALNVANPGMIGQ